jgi:hypothetical protein
MSGIPTRLLDVHFRANGDRFQGHSNFHFARQITVLEFVRVDKALKRNELLIDPAKGVAAASGEVAE